MLLLGQLAHAEAWAVRGRWAGVTSEGACAASAVGRRVEVLAAELPRGGAFSRAEIDATETRLKATLMDSVLARLAGDSVEGRRHLRDALVPEAVYSGELGVLCAAVAIEAAIQDHPTGWQAYEAAVIALARDLATGLKGTNVAVEPPRWAGGCGAGQGAAPVATALRDRLRASGSRLDEDAPTRLTLRLLPLPAGMVALEVGNGRSSLGSARLAAAWLGVDPAEAHDCRGDDSLRLPVSAGLDLRVVDLTDRHRLGTPLCVGERAEVRVTTTRPSRVQTWSVARTGEAWLLADSAESDLGGRPVGTQPWLTALDATWVPELGDATVVALAAPQGGSPTPSLVAPEAGCRVEAFGPALFATGAWGAAVPFEVSAPGIGRCPAGEAAAPVEPWRAAPACR